MMAVELVGARIIAVSFGSTIYVWGSLIGIFMAALSAGYYLGGRIADRWPTRKIMALLTLSGGVSVLLIPLAGRELCEQVSRNLLPGNPVFSGFINPMLVMLVLFTAPGVIIGTLSPFGIRLLAGDLKGLGNVSGKVYGISALGGIAGSLIVVFFLMSFLGNSVILYSSGVLMILAAGGLAMTGGMHRACEEEQ